MKMKGAEGKWRGLWQRCGHIILCWLAARFIGLCWVMGRWRILGGWRPAALWEHGQPFILCFWHGRLAMMPYCWPRHQPIHMLISQHTDGQLIARTVSHFGIQTVAGSTNKKGVAALRRLLSCLRQGDCVGITPDGPHGPRMRASMGAVALSRMSGVPLIPATYGIARGRLATSWDRFLIPFPLAYGVILWGEPIQVPRDVDDQVAIGYMHMLEESLNRLTARADHLTGRPIVTPEEKVLTGEKNRPRNKDGSDKRPE